MIGRLLHKIASSGGSIALGAAGAIAMAIPQPAFASDWGCQVILCLATPGSPTQYAACVPPITKLWNALALGGGFPTCTGVGISTRKTKRGYNLSVMRADGFTSRYELDTRYQTVTPR